MVDTSGDITSEGVAGTSPAAESDTGAVVTESGGAARSEVVDGEINPGVAEVGVTPARRPDTEAEAHTGTEAETGTGTVADPGTEAETDIEAAEAATDIDTGTGTEADTEADTEAEA